MSGQLVGVREVRPAGRAGTFLEVNQQHIITTLASWDALSDLQHLAAASSAGTSLEANQWHITVTQATQDVVWEVYLDPKWARQRLRLYGDGCKPSCSRAATQPAASEPGPTTPSPAQCSKRTKAEKGS
ncbi:hypothetical protein QJQ45_012234 [Haematococcus lacustris]|nr:hypothetical protein QJQ45_012234 [Haematococcus lacustris]